MALSAQMGKCSLDSTSLISSDPEKRSLKTRTEANAVIVQRLEKENAKLKTQYEELRCQYVQLLEEAKEEKFDERRVNLLKAQVMQLERQVILLSEGLSSQVCRSQDVEKALDPLTQRLRSLMRPENPAADVLITRTELLQLLERCEDVRQKLHRNNKLYANSVFTGHASCQVASKMAVVLLSLWRLIECVMVVPESGKV
ncbi:uncharacterized protein LOC113637559 isoform X1 [Tachysurus ichikawai]